MNNTLSDKQKTVLRLRMIGLDNKTIAHQLNISRSAVEARIRSSCAILNAENITHAVAIAMLSGQISMGDKDIDRLSGIFGENLKNFR